MENIDYSSIEQKVMEIIREHGHLDKVLEKDLYDLIGVVSDQEKTNDTIKDEMYQLVSKL